MLFPFLIIILFVIFYFPVGGVDHPFGITAGVLFVFSSFLLASAALWKGFCRFHRKLLWTIFIFIGLFIFSIFVSAVRSQSPLSSLWGSSFRSEGLAITTGFVIMFFFGIAIFQNQKNIRHAIFLIASIGTVLSLIGISQAFGYDVTQLGDKDIGVSGTLGHPSFYASALLWTLFATLSAFHFLPKQQSPTVKIRPSFVLSIVFVLQIIGLALSLTRGAWIGFLGGIIVFWIFQINFIQRKTWIRMSAAAVGAIALIFFFSQNSLSSFFDFQSGTGKLRLLWWQQGIEAIQQRPFFGYGYAAALAPLMERTTPAELSIAGPDMSLDYVHNATLDSLLAIGFIGTGLFILFIGVIALKSLRVFFYQQKNQWLIASLLSGIVAHAVNGVFIFPTLPNSLFLWIMLALLVCLTLPETQTVTEKPKKSLLFFQRIGAFLFGAFGIAFFLTLTLLQSTNASMSKEITSNNPWAEFRLKHLVQTVHRFSFFGYRRFDFDLSALETLLALRNDPDRKLRASNAFTLSLGRELEQSLFRRFPNQPHASLARLKLNGLDPSVTDQALEQEVSDLKTLYPNWHALEETAAAVFQQRKDAKSALFHWEQAAKIIPYPGLSDPIDPGIAVALLNKHLWITKQEGKVLSIFDNKKILDEKVEKILRIQKDIIAFERQNRQAFHWPF